MATFAVEADVRLRAQLNDTTLVPSNLIELCLTDAHIMLALCVDPVYFNATPPAEGLVRGEALLAAGGVFRSLASKEAFDQKALVIGGQRIEPGQRFGALMSMADALQTEAWSVLEPYVTVRCARTPAAATDTVPILGEE